MNWKVNIDNYEIECNNKKEAVQCYCNHYGKAEKLEIYDNFGKLYTKKGGVK